MGWADDPFVDVAPAQSDKRKGPPPSLEQKILRAEGSGPDSVSPKGAVGSHQIMPATGASYLRPGEDLADPQVNDRVGKQIISDLWNKYGDETAVMVAYNAGPGVADKWLAAGKDPSVLPAETQKYIGAKRSGYESDPFVRSDKWKVSDRALAYEQGRGDTDVVYMSPADYLAMTPELEGDSVQRSKRQSLRKSLMSGDDLEAIPTLDVKREGDKAKVFDQDGRNRAKFAQDEGIDLIPVAIHYQRDLPRGIVSMPVALFQRDHHLGKGVTEIEGMRGDVRPFDFQPVPKAEAGRDPRFDPTEGAKRLLYGEGGKPLPLPPPDANPRAPPKTFAELYNRPGQPQFVPVPQEGSLAPPEAAPSVPVQPQAPQPAANPMAALSGQPPGTAMPAQAPQPAAGWPGGVAPSWAAPSSQANPMARLAAPQEAPLAPLARQVFGETRVGTPEAQQSLNRVVVKEMGEDASHAQPEVMDKARQRISNGLNRIESSHAVTFDAPFRGEMNEAVTDAEKYLTTKRQIKVVKDLWRDVMVDPVKTEERAQAAKEATPTPREKKTPPKDVVRSRLSGEQFGNLIHQKGPVAKIADHPDPGVAQFGQRIERALKDLLERRLPPDVAAEYRELRYQWKAMKTIEDAVEKSPTGDIDPVKLNNAVSKHFDNRAYRRDRMDQLAKTGVQYMRASDAAHLMMRDELARVIGHRIGSFAGSVFGPPGHYAFGKLGSYIGRRLADMPRKAPTVAPPMPIAPRVPQPNSLEALIRGQ